MNFRKLEITGFKSFPDRTEIKFGAGITGIVGPNGCGKSNIADSIRWVLGEQSAKLLRGSAMQDVIFNGTEKRKSHSFSEVSLYFDNTLRIFPIEYNEVIISRKLFRDGTSEYYINRSLCRLKDIVDILRDSGIGREGYSIIGQGRIESLLSAKPENRRAIFEEAAGIAKLKAKKVESERRLERTRENIQRFSDKIDTTAHFLQPLSEQAERARKYLDLRDILKDLEINTYLYNFETASNAKQAISERLLAVCKDISERTRQYDELTADNERVFEQISSTDRVYRELSEELLQYSVELEKSSFEIKLTSERVKMISANIERLQTEKQKLVDQHQILLGLLQIGDERKVELAELVNDYTARLDKATAEYMTAIEALEQHESAMALEHQSLVDTMDKLTDVKTNMSRLLAERDGLYASKENLEARLSVLRTKSTSDSQALALEGAQFEKTKQYLSVLRDQLNAYENENSSLVRDITVLSDRIDKVAHQLSQATIRHKLLSDMKNDMEGFAHAVKKLLSDAQSNPRLAKKIQGVIGQILKVPEQFEVAIETALGGAIQNIIVEDEGDAKELIGYLRERRYGRLTFLPLSSVKPREIEPRFLPIIKRTKGVFGIADELIDFEPRFRRAVSGLLGSTVIVDNIDTATSLSRDCGYAFRVVTLEGDIFTPQGTITGGSKRTDIANIFSHEREIGELATLIKSNTEINQRLKAELEQKQTAQAVSAASLKETYTKVHAVEVDVATLAEKVMRLTEYVDEASRTEKMMSIELEKYSTRIATIEADLNSVGELESLVSTQKSTVQSGRDANQALFDELKQARESAQAVVSEIRIKLAAYENELQNTLADIERLRSNGLTIVEQIESTSTQIAESQVASEELARTLKIQIAEAEGENADRIAEIRERMANLDSEKQQLIARQHQIEAERNDLIAVLNNLNDRKAREEMQLAKVDIDIEVLEQHIREDYGLEYNDCLELRRQDFDISKAVTEINRLRRAISNLGSINIDAIEQSKAMYAEYNNDLVQRDDLLKSEAALVTLIRDLSKEMVERFSTQFEKIRQGFIKTFKELFSGGTADLILQDSEDMLEAGIEIVAQPPEKKLLNILQLSGGERALTAIAILFAILKLRPMPFCVLDEIDAALDEANAMRFAKYLHIFSRETQFIVITHRKPTMEMADTMFGVTMQEKGVSKIISVKLSEAANYSSED